MINEIKKLIQYKTLTVSYPQKTVKSTFMIGSPVFDAEKCQLCRKCIEACPTNAISVQDSKLGNVPAVNLDECIFCRFCEDACPHGAAVISSKYELAQKDRQELRATPLYITDGDVADKEYELLGAELKNKISKEFSRSLNIREVDAGSCNGCDNEVNALNNPYNDIERFGIHFVASPRHADMLLVTGPVSRNMEEALIKTYNATPSPKLVVAVGACACSGGIFKGSYAVRNGVDTLLPVDVYIPGCPPRPQAIIYGILKAIGRK
jgi:Ni,Fe-hydrogenase III small subunit/ferredoxin